MEGKLNIARYSPRCTVLGPGRRAVLWVQGCRAGCPGCITPETAVLPGGEFWTIEDLVNLFLSFENIEGITLSGGEPMLQADGLLLFAEEIRKRTSLSFMMFTGYTIEELLLHGSEAQKSLLKKMDILVDGPYIQERHADLIWRGSDNQRVLFIGDRYSEWKARMNERGVGIEVEFEHDTVHWMGIPPKGFRRQLEENIRKL
ncbi:MAG: 4Fe-4S single cluster domain-containing protein [Planctomycetia bacterium]|nr:4Fe-4S single cluster domain-containing protein [Planctomycetia bacterium]